jgi:hypothetical protein
MRAAHYRAIESLLGAHVRVEGELSEAIFSANTDFIFSVSKIKRFPRSKVPVCRK